jgi:hypothetical protein
MDKPTRPVFRAEIFVDFFIKSNQDKWIYLEFFFHQKHGIMCVFELGRFNITRHKFLKMHFFLPMRQLDQASKQKIMVDNFLKFS